LLEAAERYADGEIGRDVLLQAATEAARTWAFFDSGLDQIAYLRTTLCRRLPAVWPEGAWKVTCEAVAFTLNFSAALSAPMWEKTGVFGMGPGEVWHAEAEAHADLVREIVGNPFRPCPPLPDAVLRWRDQLVPRLARSIYEARRWADLPLLADALLDAGGDDDDLMGHCRAGRDHARGCWAVDVILGRR
jgi:hypothetical protein